jgi:hypothetical protein
MNVEAVTICWWVREKSRNLRGLRGFCNFSGKTYVFL